MDSKNSFVEHYLNEYTKLKSEFLLKRYQQLSQEI